MNERDVTAFLNALSDAAVELGKIETTILEWHEALLRRLAHEHSGATGLTRQLVTQHDTGAAHALAAVLTLIRTGDAEAP